ncbi:siderophore-interacting protein [Actinomycetospora sp. NBRC 106375]|uniref:siderophore-interacting protein n=1 Tax=Actinomycetospora sp. NBRC 106375 TaxID=3032207 RepID=UPI002555279E|nr:siderophore-interacting protein [Actinomycetospora sp. NBRC 106375]
MSVLPPLHVVATERVTPRMQRVTLGGSHAEVLAGLETIPPAAHVRLLFAEPGAPVVLPEPGPTGLTWPDDDSRPYARSMTVRALDRDRGEMAIDIALHGDSAAGRWATAARPGDPAGIVGPGGGWTPPADADEVLLAGDETALPAIAALLEWLPRHTPVRAAVEVEDAADEQELARPVRWVHRAAGGSLLDVVRARPVPDGAAAWVAGEGHVVKAIREDLRIAQGLARSHCHAIRYWTRGRSHEDSDRTFGAARAEAARRGITLVTTQDVHEMSYELMTGGFPLPTA